MLTPWLITAVCLLCFPFGLLLRRDTPMAALDRAEWPKGLNLLVLMFDPLRAGAGAWALLQEMPPLVAHLDVGVYGQAAIIGPAFAVGVVLQTIGRMNDDFVFSPFGYVAGVLVFLCGPAVAVPALVLGLGSAVAVRAWTPFFCATAAVVAILGSVLYTDRWLTWLCVGMATLLPPLLAVMLGRHMGFPRR